MDRQLFDPKLLCIPMNLQDFDFELPPELIAQFPLPQRSASRLLHLDSTNESINHYQFGELPTLLLPNDLLVFNDTKVIPARLFGQKTTGGKVEILIERILENNFVRAQIRASKTPQIGSEIILLAGNQESDCVFKVINKESCFYLLELLQTEPIEKILGQFGQIPLPPYIQHTPTADDQQRYQTIFAKNQGAVAAPTAGLHFDTQIFAALANKNIATAYLTLHVGAGTFQPVRVENILEHQMHSEYFTIGKDVVAKINAAKKNGGRVIAVGTTTVRALESAAQQQQFQESCGDTSIFIYPGYTFKIVDALITNFHLPKSTLLMLVSAFAGRENILRAYQEAIKMQYRFFSYGDAMFIT